MKCIKFVFVLCAWGVIISTPRADLPQDVEQGVEELVNANKAYEEISDEWEQYVLPRRRGAIHSGGIRLYVWRCCAVA